LSAQHLAENSKQKKMPSPKARRSFLVGMGANDHFPEGNSWPQNATIWEEFATIRRQRKQDYGDAAPGNTRKEAAWLPVPGIRGQSSVINNQSGRRLGLIPPMTGVDYDCQ
jgi:hypothetical protein